MCPVCLATMGLFVAGAASTGGLATLALKLSRKKNEARAFNPNSNQGRNQDDNEQDREPQNSGA